MMMIRREERGVTEQWKQKEWNDGWVPQGASEGRSAEEVESRTQRKRSHDSDTLFDLGCGCFSLFLFVSLCYAPVCFCFLRHHHPNHLSSFAFSLQRYRATPAEAFLSYLPFAHVDDIIAEVSE